ncbi:MAG: hypothetical protein OEY85_10330 [Rhodospirillales bacterium]|nr:hypothetical protein [Rhodospirillales bacterium]
MGQGDTSPATDEAGGDDLKKAKFVGEEEIGKRSTPRKDFISSIVLMAFGVFATVLSYQLPVTENIYTAPGILPFLTGATLCLMAFGLGYKAYKDGGADNLFSGGGMDGGFFQDEENRRTVLLILIIFAYILLADLITFDLRYPTPWFVLHFSSYESVSIPALALVLWMYWRATFLRCLLVSAVTIFALAGLFRGVFMILLPGAN